MNFKGRIILRIMWLLCCWLPLASAGSQPLVDQHKPIGYVLTMTGAMGPALEDYLSHSIKLAFDQKASMIIILLDTPGGLEKTMRLMVSQVIASPIPIITYVYPSGARAGSAGTFLVYASHVAAMAPGTNIGAATPISITNTEEKAKTTLSASEQKARNDASAYIRSLAQLRHRNVKWGEQAVLQGSSISANEALQSNVIDLIASNLSDLLVKLQGRTVNLQNQTIKLETQNIVLKMISPDWRSHFLAIITDPNIAYILLLVGIYGILFEFFNPGFILPGVAGVISLLIAFYAFQLLPVNYVGLALIFVGIGFIIAEMFYPTFGSLGVGGAIAFFIGSIMLFNRQIPGFTLFWSVIIAVTFVTLALLIFIIQLAIRAQRRPIVSGREQLIGSTGHVMLKLGEQELPRMRVRGEVWQIRSEFPLHEGEWVKVVGIEELFLLVEPLQDLNKEG
jgi:membrane-bound serine protease (ClpP class)